MLSESNAILQADIGSPGELLDLVLGQLTDGLALADPSGTIRYLNAEAERIFRTTAEEFSRDTVMVRTLDGQPCDFDDMPLFRALNTREPVQASPVRVERENGDYRIVEVGAGPLSGPDGQNLGAVAVYRDVTEQFRRENERQEDMATLVHDLKSPLTVVKGTAQILRLRMEQAAQLDPDFLRECLERVERSADRMSRLADEFMDVARLDAGQTLELNLKPIDLVDLVSQTIEDQRDISGNRELVLETDTSSRVGMWDVDRLERVLNNLLSNAVKYSSDESMVCVTLGEETVDERRMAIVTVRDGGIGITGADLPDIFTRFKRGSNVRRTQKGTGIGLSGSRQIVEQHGGTLDIASTGPQGTTFVLRLPLESRPNTAE